MADLGQHRARRRRGGLLAVLSIALLGPIAASAQESPPETGEIRNGTAKATALISRIGPGVGDLELAMRGGIAVAQVTNSLAQATSHTLNLGLIGTSITSETCRGSRYIHEDDLPQPTSVDNRKGDARAARDELGSEGSPFGLGRMRVEADEEPVRSQARTTANGFDVTPVLRFGTGRATAVAEVLPGEGRQATAEVVSSMDLGGVVTMQGMRWHAHHRTGREPTASAGFEWGRASVEGAAIPQSDSAAFEQAANTALAPLGAAITLPRVERFLEPTDLIRVTPMRLEIRDTPAGRLVFGPLLDATRGGRGELFDTLTEQVCDLASFFLVGDVVLSVLSGTGFLIIDLGGAEASSSDFELLDPFGAPIPPPATGVGVPDPVGAPTASGGGAGPAAPGALPTTAGTPDDGPIERAASRSGPFERICESVHPNGDSCSDGAGAVVGLLALLGTAGVAGADLFRRRRAADPEVVP